MRVQLKKVGASPEFPTRTVLRYFLRVFCTDGQRGCANLEAANDSLGAFFQISLPTPSQAWGSLSGSVPTGRTMKRNRRGVAPRVHIPLLPDDTPTFPTMNLGEYVIYRHRRRDHLSYFPEQHAFSHCTAVLCCAFRFEDPRTGSSSTAGLITR